MLSFERRRKQRGVAWIQRALFALPLFAFACRSAPDAPAPAPALEHTLAADLDALARNECERQQWVGLSVAIGNASGITHVAHFGFEDRERKVPTSDATMYRWASISKPLTAVVAMQLAREGQLDLDRDLHVYVPEFPPQAHPITARQLLCHQAGIVHYTNGPVVPTPPRTDVAHPFEDAVDALSTFAASPLLFEPGTKYAYSTHGYVLLGAVLQRAGGARFENLVSQHIAVPLGMTTLCPDKQWVDIPHRTIGYRKNAAGEMVPSEDGDVSWKLAGGGYISTIGDLARFGSGMLACRVVDRATREEMWTTQATKSGEATDYGLGFRIAKLRDNRLVLHGGAQEKTRTRLLLLPENDLVVVLMCNSEWADLQPLGQQLCERLLDAR